jgi:coenzyme F420-0:L-glutamate ligase/coenzyme F420-1:gamma-L-glutamate ligase
MQPLESFAGSTDGYGNALAVTAPAIADEVAGIAEVVSGKLGGRPFIVLRGLDDRVLPVGEHGPGARALVREASADMFGLGTREAVVAALSGRDRFAFGAPADAGDLAAALAECGLQVTSAGDRLEVATASDDPRVVLLAFAHGWEVEPDDSSDSCTVLVRLS